MPPSSSSSETLQRRNRPSAPGRMGMRKWLEHLLDDGQCQGLEWENKPRKIFSIVWKHASSQGFDHSKHADVFMQWAQYKGRTAVKGEKNQKKKKGDNYDSKYKSTFRCALHSLIDCIEISGDEDGPKKFFQFISPTDPQYKERRDKKRNSYNKKAQKRTHDGKFSDGQKTAHNIDVKKDELKERCGSNENEIKTLQKTEFGHNIGEKIMSYSKGIKANDDEFSEGQKTAHNIDIKKVELKEECENEIMTLQEARFGTALEEDQNTVETLTENPHQLSGQSFQTLPHPTLSLEMGNTILPFITVLSKETTGKVEIIYGETSQEPSSSLPNFEALGVKDQYGPKTYMTSKLLASGGDMQVKKVTEEATEFAEPWTVEYSDSNNVNPGFELTTTSPEEVEELLGMIPENPPQDTDVNNPMITPQDQEGFNNPFPPHSENSGVITRTSNILSDIDMQFSESLGLDFLSEPDLPFCNSF